MRIERTDTTWSMSLGALLGAVLLPTSPARAYTYESPISDGCHESITAEALRVVRGRTATAGPLPSTEADATLAAELPFAVDADMEDIGAVALLLGVREPDLRGSGPTDLTALASVHGDPDRQHEHCLRGPQHDEPHGSSEALAACREHIRALVFAAIDDGLDGSGHPNVGARAELDVHLPFSGEVSVPLPSFYLHMGEALHTLQDSFTHTLRSGDHDHVRVVTNWVDDADIGIEEERDGPPHIGAMDACNDPQETVQHARRGAVEASIALMEAALDPALDAAARKQAVDAVLDVRLGFEAGCSFENGWCDAPQLELIADDVPSCAVQAGRGGSGGGAFVLASLCLLLAVRRRRAPGTALALALLLSATGAQAQGNPGSDLALHASTGVAVDNPGASLTAGARLRIADDWDVGLDAEWNPWFSLDTNHVEPGAAAAYLTLVRRYPMSRDIALHSSVSAGVSTLLFDIVGAPAGDFGLYGALSLLGIHSRISRRSTLVVDPLAIVIPVPHVAGFPYAYAQYRSTVGLLVEI